MPLNVYDLTDNVNATAKKISKCFEKPAQNCTLLYSNAKSFIFLLHFIGDILMATKTSLTPPTIYLQIDTCLNTKIPIEELKRCMLNFKDLEMLTSDTGVQELETAATKYASYMNNCMEAIRFSNSDSESILYWISRVNEMMSRAWKVPYWGHELGNTLCDVLRQNGGLDILIDNCVIDFRPLQFQSAKLLQQCLVTANRGYVVEKGLHKVIDVAKNYTENIVRNLEEVRVGTGILEHLFKHSETTCSDVIAMGGLGNKLN